MNTIRLLPVLLAFCGAIATWVYDDVQPVYTTTGLMQLNRGLGTAAATRGPGKRDYGDEMVLLRTKAFRAMVQQELSPEERRVLAKHGTVRKASTEEAQDDAATKGLIISKSGAVISRLGETSLFKVTVESNDARNAAGLVNATMRAAITANASSALRRATMVQTFFAPRVMELKEKISQDESEESRLDRGGVETFEIRTRHPVAPSGDTRQRLTFAGSRKRRGRGDFGARDEVRLAKSPENIALLSLNAAERRARLGSLLAEDRLRLLEADGVEASASPAASGVTAELGIARVKLAQAEITYGTMQTTLGPANPELQAQLADLKVLEQRVQSLNRGLLASGRDELAQDQNVIRLLHQAAADEQKRVFVDVAAEKHLYALDLNLAINLTLLGDLQDRLNSLPAEEILNGLMVEIVSPAQVPVDFIQRSTARVVAFGMIWGVAIAFALVFLLHLLTLAQWTASGVERNAGVPVLALLPRTRGGAWEVTRADMSDGLETLGHSLPMMRKSQGNAVVFFTASLPGEGTTTVAAEFACGLAQSGLRVLLLDANFFRPRVQEYFALAAHAGVTDILASNATLAEAVQQVRATGTGLPLDVLVGGLAPMHPDVALDAEGFATLLAQARLLYRYVIVDSAVTASFGGSVSYQADIVLLVARFGWVSLHQIAKSSARLAHAGLTLGGVVLNGIPARGSRSL